MLRVRLEARATSPRVGMRDAIAVVIDKDSAADTITAAAMCRGSIRVGEGHNCVGRGRDGIDRVAHHPTRVGQGLSDGIDTIHQIADHLCLAAVDGGVGDKAICADDLQVKGSCA